jgi:hypothetical protein
MIEIKKLSVFVALIVPILSVSAAQAKGKPDAAYDPRPCSAPVTVATSNVGADVNLDPAVRKVLVPLDKDPSPFLELPHPSPKMC